MKELIGLFTQIALLRRGPQDLPASMLLLVLTIGGYLCVNLLVALALPPVPHAAAASAHAVEGQWLAPLLIERCSLWFGTSRCCASRGVPSACCRPPPPCLVSRQCWRR